MTGNNSSQVEPLTTPKPLKDIDHDLLNLLEQYYSMYRGFPSKAELEETYPQLIAQPMMKHYERALRNPQFRYALSVRGIVVPEVATKGVLTELQLAVASTMFDYVDNRTFRKKLSELGVSSQTYQNWLNDPAFQSYVTQRGEMLLSNHQHEAHAALIDRVRSGELGAIKYFNELTGRYRPNAEVKAIDVNEVLMRVLEVIQKHVRDATTLGAIAEDLMLLGNKATGQAPLQAVVSSTATQLPVGPSRLAAANTNLAAELGL